ncbi:hypothetical protein C7Y66_28600, partial [Chroococcidiopsis sp. CCALA 051]
MSALEIIDKVVKKCSNLSSYFIYCNTYLRKANKINKSMKQLSVISREQRSARAHEQRGRGGE